MSTFELLVTAYDTVVFSGHAVSLVATTRDGEIGMEANHEPMIALLKEDAALRFTGDDGAERTVAVHTGVLTFSGNRCTIVIEAE